eukprot:CAMPEP_0116141140 /NCGR_PEP_ID=MMETSP0329-20121206/14223_1 /TAXON_ID=697910 /ORGANISM="Pseudo-nitzschia arenysensis, Strain B593" /LENGTH=547 /DNA_ID=CAMNT_0003636303 /DNA_START=259 /DNA_END=1902 /DNA_ORIENTATION=+
MTAAHNTMPRQSVTRRCKRLRNDIALAQTNRPFSLQGLLLLSCLLLVHFSNFDDNSASQSFLVAQAFVTDHHTSGSTNKRTTKPSLRTNQQNHQQKHSPSSSKTALHFFFNNNNDENVQKDLPLARYVDVSANYTLAYTPEDYIDLEENQRLICIGDVHGDLGALQQFLQTAGVYDAATDSWCGGNTVVVQCGDILDRGFEELACYRLLSKLSQQAPTQNGKVILLIGNHEALNAMGLFQYAFTDLEHEQCIGKEVDSILGVENQWRKQYANNQPSRWASYEPGGLLAHSLLRNMKVAVRVGGTLCVHAGMKANHLTENGGIDQMNAAFREWISLGDDVGIDQSNGATNSQQQQQQAYKPPIRNPVIYNHNGNYATPRQPWIDAEKRQQHYINSIPPFLQSKPEDPGPIWMREYSTPHDEPPNPANAFELERDLDSTLTLVHAHRMVMGHTIQRQINGIFKGKAWRLDVGASKGCLNGTPEVLEVVCKRNPETEKLYEEVSVLVPSQAPQQDAAQQQQPQQQPSMGRRIPATERMVDAYTQAAVELL